MCYFDSGATPAAWGTKSTFRGSLHQGSRMIKASIQGKYLGRRAHALKEFNEKRHRASVLLRDEVAEYVPDGGGLLQREKVVWRIPLNPIGLGLPIVVPCLKRWRQFHLHPNRFRCCLGGLLPKFASASLPPRRQASLPLRKFGHTRKSPVVCKWALESKTNATMMYRHQSKVLPVP